MRAKDIAPPHQVGDDHWPGKLLLTVDGVNEAEEKESLLIANAINIFGLGMFEVICIAISHNSRNIVVLPLLLCSVGGDIEGDIFRVRTTRQKLAVVVAPGVDEN